MFSILLFPTRQALAVHAECIIAIGFLLCAVGMFAQTEQLPYMNAGPNSVFGEVDVARVMADEQAWRDTAKNLQSTLVDSGTISALDIAAPDNALKQYKEGTRAMKSQRTKEAIRYFEKAVRLYPDFVSAHNALGLAYLDQQDLRAGKEFEIAAKLDDRFPDPFLNLGLMAISGNDFAAADSNLSKAAALTANDPRILTALAFAEYGHQRYEESIRTARRAHSVEHHGFANVHYIAAASAMSLHDLNAANEELRAFLNEDPSNPFAPAARQHLEDLSSGQVSPKRANTVRIEELPPHPRMLRITFPNSEYLHTQLNAVASEPDPDVCALCNVPPTAQPTREERGTPVPIITTWNRLFTIHQIVDETALFFSVSQHGRSVNDLSLSDIQVRDDNKPPERILQFIPQSRLPLRLGLHIDGSESVRDRVAFEKRAAEKFIEKVLTSDSDLAFIEGFQNEISVTQDFTRDPTKLVRGIETLASGGDGTAIFDAVFHACWKLSAYPDQVRTAKVLVVLSDGEDNSSHRTLKQAIQEAEAAGVTVYTVSTAQKLDDQDSDANNILKLLAERTGGASLFPGGLRALDSYLNELPETIRSRYLVAYRPADFKPDGRFRRIRVTAARNGKRLRVHVRGGYYARSTFSPNYTQQ
jgi:VWFA-related protein